MTVKDLFTTFANSRPTLWFFGIIGQSQAGGFNSNPALTTTSHPDVITFEDGPIDSPTDLAPPNQKFASVEGDTFSTTSPHPGPYSPGPVSNVETIATSFGQQLRLWRGDTNDKYYVTVQAYGGSTIQQLTNESSGAWVIMKDLLARGKDYADYYNMNFQCNLIFFHGGNGDNVTTSYKAKEKDLASRFRTYAATLGVSNAYFFTHQQRPIGSPDYGIQQYEASKEDNKIILCTPEYVVPYNGDGIHLPNHSERWMAMHFANAVYKTLWGAGHKPLELDIATATFNGTNEITIPILNATGAIQSTGNCGIQVYSKSTASVLASTTVVVASSLKITISGTNIGRHDLVIRTAIAANGSLCDSEGSTRVPNFLNASGVPYSLNKYVVRAEYALTVSFPVNYLASFGGNGSAPTIANTYVIWDSTKSTSNEEYIVSGNVKITAVNDATNYIGWSTSDPGKAGNQSALGTNFVDNNIVGNYWFVDNKIGSIKLSGLIPSKLYDLETAGIRTGTSTARRTKFGCSGTYIIKVSNRATSTSIFTSISECAVFTNIAADANGEIIITFETDGTQFGYMNYIRVTQKN